MTFRLYEDVSRSGKRKWEWSQVTFRPKAQPYPLMWSSPGPKQVRLLSKTLPAAPVSGPYFVSWDPITDPSRLSLGIGIPERQRCGRAASDRALSGLLRHPRKVMAWLSARREGLCGGLDRSSD